MKTGRRRAGEPELMSAKDAAQELGTQQSNLRTIAGLPEPYQEVAAGTLYRAEEIRALARKRRPKAA